MVTKHAELKDNNTIAPSPQKTVQLATLSP
jgi:hypothetical protein